ncbi:unnamed protein product, partial [Amoebophrya sp. A120]
FALENNKTASLTSATQIFDTGQRDTTPSFARDDNEEPSQEEKFHSMTEDPSSSSTSSTLSPCAAFLASSLSTIIITIIAVCLLAGATGLAVHMGNVSEGNKQKA